MLIPRAEFRNNCNSLQAYNSSYADKSTVVMNGYYGNTYLLNNVARCPDFLSFSQLKQSPKQYAQ